MVLLSSSFPQTQRIVQKLDELCSQLYKMPLMPLIIPKLAAARDNHDNLGMVELLLDRKSEVPIRGQLRLER